MTSFDYNDSSTESLHSFQGYFSSMRWTIWHTLFPSILKRLFYCLFVFSQLFGQAQPIITQLGKDQEIVRIISFFWVMTRSNLEAISSFSSELKWTRVDMWWRRFCMDGVYLGDILRLISCAVAIKNRHMDPIRLAQLKKRKNNSSEIINLNFIFSHSHDCFEFFFYALLS